VWVASSRGLCGRRETEREYLRRKKNKRAVGSGYSIFLRIITQTFYQLVFLVGERYKKKQEKKKSKSVAEICVIFIRSLAFQAYACIPNVTQMGGIREV